VQVGQVLNFWHWQQAGQASAERHAKDGLLVQRRIEDPSWPERAQQAAAHAGLQRIAAEGLLAVAEARVECLRTGVRELSATPGPLGSAGAGRRALVARLTPMTLAASAQVRLRRLHPAALYKEEPRQLMVPLPAGADPATVLAGLIRELVPPPPGEGGNRPPVMSADSMPVS
jgi:hypothetical protein